MICRNLVAINQQGKPVWEIGVGKIQLMCSGRYVQDALTSVSQ